MSNIPFIQFVTHITNEAANGFGKFCSNMNSIDGPALREILGQAVRQEYNPETRVNDHKDVEEFEDALRHRLIELLVIDFFMKHSTEILAINTKVLALFALHGEDAKAAVTKELIDSCAPIDDTKYDLALNKMIEHNDTLNPTLAPRVVN